MLHITYKYINNYKMRGQNKRQQGCLVNAYKLIMYNNNEMTATSFTCIILTINSIKAMPLIANVQFISQLSLILYDLNLYISNDLGGYFAKIVYIYTPNISMEGLFQYNLYKMRSLG